MWGHKWCDTTNTVCGNTGMETMTSFQKIANSRSGSPEVSVESSHSSHLFYVQSVDLSIAICSIYRPLPPAPLRDFSYSFACSLLTSFQREKPISQSHILWHLFMESVFSDKRWLLSFSSDDFLLLREWLLASSSAAPRSQSTEQRYLRLSPMFSVTRLVIV